MHFIYINRVTVVNYSGNLLRREIGRKEGVMRALRFFQVIGRVCCLLEKFL